MWKEKKHGFGASQKIAKPTGPKMDLINPTGPLLEVVDVRVKTTVEGMRK